MSNFTLPEDALARLAAQINLNGTFNHTVRSPWGGHQVMFKLKVERGLADTACTVEMGGERHSITVRHADPERHIQLADLIDAIANGRVDSAAVAPPRVTRLAILPEPEPMLDAQQDAALRLLVRKGGTLDLHMGLKHPIKLAVHRNHPRHGAPYAGGPLPGITVILSIGETQPRTVCWSAHDTEARLHARLATSVEQLVTVATPATRAA